MKKRKRSRTLASAGAPEGIGSETLHIRLCHVCLHLNESEHEIETCQKCQRYLTIENLVEERLSRQARQEMEEMEMMGPHQEIRKGGLNGLAVRW